MKRIFSILILLICSSQVKAECHSASLTIFPSSSSVCQNPIFIIEGYGLSEDIVTKLNINYPVYLQSGSKKINLLVVEVLEGDLYLTQAILKPAAELEAGVEYILLIDSLPKSQPLKAYNPSTRTYTPYTYKTLAKKDTENPVLKSEPKEVKKVYQHFGCGPAINVVYAFKINDESHVFVKTCVKNTETGKTTTYYLMLLGGQIRVGQDMCAGAFSLKTGNMFEVTFSFMDASGNVLPWNGKTLRFARPTPENSVEE
ncbi:MAG: hypothetical protein ACK5Z2_11555 [Bacteroidota bacterium]|jgi:hypothetical protein